jgi:hypothetical protein
LGCAGWADAVLKSAGKRNATVCAGVGAVLPIAVLRIAPAFQLPNKYPTPAATSIDNTRPRLKPFFRRMLWRPHPSTLVAMSFQMKLNL